MVVTRVRLDVQSSARTTRDTYLNWHSVDTVSLGKAYSYSRVKWKPDWGMLRAAFSGVRHPHAYRTSYHAAQLGVKLLFE